MDQNEVLQKWFLDNLPVGVLLEDFSEVYQYLDDIGVTDKNSFMEYFQNNPDHIWEIPKRIAFKYANCQALSVLQSKSLDAFRRWYCDFNNWPNSDWIKFFYEEA